MALKRLVLTLIGVLLIASSLLFLFVSKSSLISFIVAFISSTIVVIASFKTYQNMVNKRLALNDGAYEIDNRDTIDKLEDPYNLYDEQKNTLVQDLKEAIKQEKELAKKNRRSLKETAKDSATAFSFSRILAYALLVGGFFYLLNSNYLNLYYYLPTLALPNMIAVIFLLNSKK